MEVIGTEVGYYIVRIDAPFGIGFNVYRPAEDLGGDQVRCVKANAPETWFKTESAARQWARDNPQS